MVTLFRTKLYGWESGQELHQIYAKDGSLYNTNMNSETQSSTNTVNLAPVLAVDKIHLKKNETEYPSADVQFIIAEESEERIVTSVRLTVDQLASLFQDLHSFKKNLDNNQKW